MVRRTNWGGSIATFIAVTVILLTGLVGSIYLLNQRGKQARTEQEIATTKQEENKENTSGTEKNESENSDQANKSEGSDSDTNARQQELSQAGYLPQTGPEVLPWNLLAVYALSVSATAFIMSRQKS